MTTSSAEKPKKSCFVIAPIGPTGSDTRKRSDKVLKHIFRSALEEKYKVTRADEIDEAGMITSQVLQAVQDSHLVVADLTETNPNVLYELAVRHAVEKPVIHVIEPRISKIPFDIAGFRTIEFDITDPDSIESAVASLRKQAEQAELGKWGDTPIKLANVMRPSKGDSPELLLLKQAVAGIATISERLGHGDDLSAFWGRDQYSNLRGLLTYDKVTGGALSSLYSGGKIAATKPPEADSLIRETLGAKIGKPRAKPDPK
jgi:hypothetical protein